MVLDGKRRSDGLIVCIKRINPKEATDEVKIASFRDLISPKVEYIIMPSLRPYANPEFGAVGEVVDFVTQMIESWENMADLQHFYEVKDALRKGLANLEKWYRKVTDVDAYFICLVLDPNIKTAYTEDKWKPEFHKADIKHLGEVFDSYYIPPTKVLPNNNHGVVPRVVGKAEGQYGYAWMQNAVWARIESERGQSSPRDELTCYLESPLKKVDDVIRYWGLHIKTFEALQLLKSAYRNGHIDASSEAQKHFDSVMEDAAMDDLSDTLIEK
ncbi:hypothetical protein DXG03_002335 [Asterophora parasitica]|uniref:Uncharacterized protein n=1 Tax=Asterophora parasitica TaxID=117018 RepID=A0A9P7G243_9AGAR|nr:hypothetical protein DXG03_002335 [Asterophora parasitica]